MPRAQFQASTRRRLPLVEWERQPVRINPLALWSRQQIMGYVLAHDVPYNPLYDQGYPQCGLLALHTAPTTPRPAIDQARDGISRKDGVGIVSVTRNRSKAQPTAPLTIPAVA